ncbi:MAG: hypothetical protein R3F37_02490 [Candidatus Competibacteraceae bacterium]
MSTAHLQRAFVSALCVRVLSVSGMLLTAHAEDRACWIGVGDYDYSSIKDLPGIDLDIQMMLK